MGHKKEPAMTPAKGECFICRYKENHGIREPFNGDGRSWANRDHTLCAICAAQINKYMLQRVAYAAITAARTARCRVSEGASIEFALVNKEALNKLKRELRSYAPGCLGKE